MGVKSVDSGQWPFESLIIPYKAIHGWFIILFGIMTGSLSADYSWAWYRWLVIDGSIVIPIKSS